MWLTVLANIIYYYNSLSHFVTWTLIYETFAVVLFSWFIYTQFIYVHVSSLRKLPSTTFIPIVGSVPDLINSEAGEYAEKWMKKLNTAVFRFFWLFGQEKICVADADVAREILINKCKIYPKSPKDYQLLKDVLGNGLVTAEGAFHRRNRKLCNGSFKINILKNFVPIFDKTVQDLIEVWLSEMNNAEKDNFDDQTCLFSIEEEMTNLTLDIIGKCVFDYEFNAIQHCNGDITNNFKKLISGFKLTWNVLFHLFFPSVRTKYAMDRKQQIENVSKVVYSVIKTKRKEFEGSLNATENSSLLATLLVARDEETDESMDDIQLRDEVMTFMLAGHETTSIGLTWCLLMMARHPDKQEKIRNEIRSILTPGQTLTFDDLDKLTYTHCFIQETMRLYPPVPLVIRWSAENNYIKDYYFPKGVSIDINIVLLHRNPKYWDNPTEFRPERFEDVSKIYPHSYLPFVAGSRMCIGYKFAMMEMKVALARLASKFEFLPIPHKKYKKIMFITMKPEPNLVLRVRKLNDTK